jgi:hypothetical protein
MGKIDNSDFAKMFEGLNGTNGSTNFDYEKLLEDFKGKLGFPGENPTPGE